MQPASPNIGPETLKSIDSLKHLSAMKLDHKTSLTLLAPSFSNFDIRPPLTRRAVHREHRQIDLTGLRPVFFADRLRKKVEHHLGNQGRVPGARGKTLSNLHGQQRRWRGLLCLLDSSRSRTLRNASPKVRASMKPLRTALMH